MRGYCKLSGTVRWRRQCATFERVGLLRPLPAIYEAVSNMYVYERVALLPGLLATFDRVGLLMTVSNIRAGWTAQPTALYPCEARRTGLTLEPELVQRARERRELVAREGVAAARGRGAALIKGGEQHSSREVSSIHQGR